MGGLVADGTRVYLSEPRSRRSRVYSSGSRISAVRSSAGTGLPHRTARHGRARSRAAPGTALRSLSATRLRLEEHLFTSPHWARRTSTQGRPHDTHTGHLRLFTFQSLRLRVGYIVHHHTIDHSITS